MQSRQVRTYTPGDRMPIEIPDHLRYREPKATPNYYSGVLPRYLSPPKKRSDVDPLEDARRASSSRVVNPQFAMVESRYRSPPKLQSASWTRPEEEPLPKHMSVRPTTEYVTHKRQAAVFQHIPSKYYDMYVTQSQPGPTPREQIAEKHRQERQQISKDGRTFSPVLGRSKVSTFGQPDPLPTRKRTGQSVVMEWVKHGIPIPSSRQEPAAKPRLTTNTTPFFAPGGAGGGSYTRRNTSPTRLAALQEERLVTHVKERLLHPKATTDSIQRLSQPRTTSPTRAVSPSRGSINRTVSPVRQANSAIPAKSAPSARATQPAICLRTVSPRRIVRPATEPPQRRMDSPNAQGRTASPVRNVSPAQSRASPSTTRRAPHHQSPPPSGAGAGANDVDVQISVLTDYSDLSDTPHIRPTSGYPQRHAVLFQSPPHLASP